MSDLCSAETPVVQLNQVTTSQKQPLDPLVDPGEGPGPLPHIFSPSWGSKGWKKFFWDRHHPILSQGLDDQAPSAIQQGKVDGPVPPPKFSTNSHKYWSLTEVQDFIYFVPHYVVHPITFPCQMHSLRGTPGAQVVTVLIVFSAYRLSIFFWHCSGR